MAELPTTFEAQPKGSDTGERCALKGARSVREGADGKGPEGTSSAAYFTLRGLRHEVTHVSVMTGPEGPDVTRCSATGTLPRRAVGAI